MLHYNSNTFRPLTFLLGCVTLLALSASPTLAVQTSSPSPDPFLACKALGFGKEVGWILTCDASCITENCIKESDTLSEALSCIEEQVTNCDVLR